MEDQKHAYLPAPTNSYKLNSEIDRSISHFFSCHPPIQKPSNGDWTELREIGDQLFVYMNDHLPLNAHIIRQEFEIESVAHSVIPLRWYSTGNIDEKTAAVVYIHGGGRMFGSVDHYDRLVADYVHRSKVPFLSVEYGLAPDTYGKAQAEQALDAIIWLKQNAGQLGVDADRIAVMGDSGGGGLAAGAAILARDRNIQLAKQILIYPMLDHRNRIPNEDIEPFAFFGHKELNTLWQAILGPDTLSDYDLMITSPSMLDDFAGLAPTYISIGDLDYFRNENLEYARKLASAAVPLEFHLHPGAPHGFELFTPDTVLAERATAGHVSAIRSI